jgi:hypothetical protein
VSAAPRCPALYQLNTRVRLTEIGRGLGRRATLDDIGDAEVDRWAAQGFDWVWLLSVWHTGDAGRRVSLANPDWRREFEATLPDLSDDDVGGSGFAIRGYTVHDALGGDAALQRLRERMRRRGLKLMLDFVPNHLALDHPWVQQHPDRFVQGRAEDLDRAPRNWCRIATPAGPTVFAHGRDPSFDGWPDTLQLDWSNPAVHEAMRDELLRIATRCDGVRCDMAMLLEPEVFERTWGRRCEPFWPRAIAAVKAEHPGFEFAAEVYWDLEWALQQQGFDHTYDKRLVDRLRAGAARPVREHLQAGLDYQDRLLRFLENHDEPRAAAVFDRDAHVAAALVAYSTPGLRLFHQGQLEGRRLRVSPHLVRAPDEPVDAAIAAFYARLLDALKHPLLRDGRWTLLDCQPAWDGNPTADDFVAWAWTGDAAAWLCAAVNFSPHPSQCFVRLPAARVVGPMHRFIDRIGGVAYDRHGDDLLGRGLYLDLPAWGGHLFEVRPID